MSIQAEVKKSFRVYSFQQPAFDVEERDPDSRVFSFEAPELEVGRRRYITARLADFHHFYSTCECPRHFYEIIRPNRPCRPYFDLEFAQNQNPDLDGVQCVRDYVSICRDVFSEMLGLEVDERQFLILDSTTETKFSAHVIVHLPDDRLLASNADMKPLLVGISEKMNETGRCLIQNAANQRAPFYDPSVYSKNRNFRLVHSSKCGKPTTLEYAAYSTFYGDERTPDPNRLFHDSLVVPDDHKKFPLVDSLQLNIAAAAIETEQRKRARRPSANCDVGIEKFLRVLPSVSASTTDLRVAGGESPFVELNRFVLETIRPFSPRVQIRRHSLIFLPSFCRRQIQYEFTGSRFCHNKGREHKPLTNQLDPSDCVFRSLGVTTDVDNVPIARVSTLVNRPLADRRAESDGEVEIVAVVSKKTRLTLRETENHKTRDKDYDSDIEVIEIKKAKRST